MEYTIVLVDAVEELLLDADICSVTLHISVDFVGMLRSRTARASSPIGFDSFYGIHLEHGTYC